MEQDPPSHDCLSSDRAQFDACTPIQGLESMNHEKRSRTQTWVRDEIERQRNPSAAKTEKIFACPFYKYNPYKFSTDGESGTEYRICAGTGFKNVSMVK